MPPRRRHITNITATDLVRHVAFANATGAKKNSNTINNNGTLRTAACFQCVSALQNYQATLPVGRGSKVANEYFCCVVDRSLGNGGRECGRCVGLGKTCIEVPATEAQAASDLISQAPQYNRLIAVADQTSHSAADTPFLTNLVSSAQRFHATCIAIPNGIGSRTRRAAPPDSDDVTQGVQDTRTDVTRLITLVAEVGNSVADLRDDVFEACRLGRQNRSKLKQIMSKFRIGEDDETAAPKETTDYVSDNDSEADDYQYIAPTRTEYNAAGRRATGGKGLMQ